MPETGYIEQQDVCGILGAWYTFGCPGATIVPAAGQPVTAVAGQICFSGTVPQVTNHDFATTYGAAVGFDVCGMPATTVYLPPPMNTWVGGSKHTVAECHITLTHIAFDLTGTLSPEFRVVFAELGRTDNAYLGVPGVGHFCGAVADARVGYADAAPPIDVSRVQSVQFRIVSVETGPVSFDFCLQNLAID